MGKSEAGKFATAVNCIDGRAQLPVNEFIRSEYRVDYVDTITIPGVDGVLSSEKEDEKERIKRFISISVSAHGSSLVAVCGHHDCAGNPVSSEEHIKLIKEGMRKIKEWFPKVRVVGLWVNEKWKVEKVGEIG